MCLMYHGKIDPSPAANTPPRRVSQTCLDLASDLGLEQMVQFLTCGENMLDLIFTSHPSYQEKCKSLPPISESCNYDIVQLYRSSQPTDQSDPDQKEEQSTGLFYGNRRTEDSTPQI